MQYLLKKTSLAIAISESIKQVGIQKQQQNIMKIFKQSFMAKYESFKNTNTSNVSANAKIFNNYQYPIGQDDRQQYYTGLIYQAKFPNTKIPDMITDMINGQKKPLILIQAYSKNQDPKRKAPTKSNKSNKIDSVKKKVKKD